MAKERRSLADLLYRLFIAAVFISFSILFLFIAAIDETARHPVGLTIAVAALATGLSALMPQIIGTRMYKFVLLPMARSVSFIFKIVSSAISIRAKAISHSISESSFFKFIDQHSGTSEILFDARWFIRYPLAVAAFGVCVGTLILGGNTDDALKYAIWIWTAISGIYLLIWARELVGIGIFLLLLDWISRSIGMAIEDMSPSKAILLGAGLIALAIYYKKGNP